ncbi:MAG: GTP-binding protein [Actinobacteria bacterium]|nr:GTP-binding protein [Actinomycetota bacterium]
MLVDVIGGFLGSGKTTAILHQLSEKSFDPARTVILVNEFGEVGVDGVLLDTGESSVRELPSGCICCSLKADFVMQVEDIARTFAPERLVVEPSGVAAMRDILQALSHERVAHLIERVRTVLVLDPDDHDWFIEMSDVFVGSQVGLAQLILLNKADLATPELLARVTADLEERNPHAVVLPTSHGRFSWEQVDGILPPLPSPVGESARLDGFESFSAEVPDVFDLESLRGFFARLADGTFGDVARAKGVFRTDEDGGSHRLDLATRRVHETSWPSTTSGRINVIGRGIDSDGIREALTAAAAARDRA